MRRSREETVATLNLALMTLALSGGLEPGNSLGKMLCPAKTDVNHPSGKWKLHDRSGTWTINAVIVEVESSEKAARGLVRFRDLPRICRKTMLN
jgi:hypothetical protein